MRDDEVKYFLQLNMNFHSGIKTIMSYSLLECVADNPFIFTLFKRSTSILLNGNKSVYSLLDLKNAIFNHFNESKHGSLIFHVLNVEIRLIRNKTKMMFKYFSNSFARNDLLLLSQVLLFVENPTLFSAKMTSSSV